MVVIKRYVQRVSELESARIRVEWVSEKDKGIYDAMNKGICKATGDYIQILNGGDLLAAPNVIERMMSELAKHKYPDMLYGNSVDIEKKRRNVDVKEIEYSMRHLYRGTYPHEGSYYKRDLFSRERYGLYDDTLRIASDWKWFLQAIGLGNVKPVYVDVDVVLFDTNGISSTNKELSNIERRKVLEDLLPPAILADYDKYALDIEQMNRLRRHHLYGLVYFTERVLFKLEKWHVISR